jgi:hypothetical protein
MHGGSQNSFAIPQSSYRLNAVYLKVSEQMTEKTRNVSSRLYLLVYLCVYLVLGRRDKIRRIPVVCRFTKFHLIFISHL